MAKVELTRRRKRTKFDIEQCIIKAAIELIEKEGFSELAVTDIMKKAQIEPIVFYNRYDNLNDFINEFVKDYDYWFSDIVKEHSKEEKKKEKYVALLQSLLKSLKGNKIMQQLLKWELSTDNEIARRTAQFREIHTLPLAKEYEDIFSDSPIDIVAISALIIGGIYYLILHDHLTTFSGININSEEGEERVCKAITYLTDMLFSERSAEKSIIEVIQKMKKNNITIEVIADCTGVPIEAIKKI